MRTTSLTSTRPRLVARWVLVTDAHGRTRPEMRWELDREQPQVTLAA